MYLNFKGCKGIETAEDLKGMSRKERATLLKEYQLVSNGYYISNRATKDYYENQKGE